MRRGDTIYVGLLTCNATAAAAAAPSAPSSCCKVLHCSYTGPGINCSADVSAAARTGATIACAVQILSLICICRLQLILHWQLQLLL
jgi:hypothetical protein